MQRPSCQHDHLARLSCSQAGPRCRGGPPASRHQHRATARCSGGMESAVRSAWVESATIAHAQKTGRCQRRRALAATKPNLSRAEPCPPGTEFLDAETGPPKSAPETTYARRDQKDPKPVAQIPANGLSEPGGKLPGSYGLGGGGCSRAKPVSKSEIPCEQGNLQGISRNLATKRRLFSEKRLGRRHFCHDSLLKITGKKFSITGKSRALAGKETFAGQALPHQPRLGRMALPNG